MAKEKRQTMIYKTLHNDVNK